MSPRTPHPYPAVPDEQLPGEMTQSARFITRVILGFLVVCVLAVVAARFLAPEPAIGLRPLARTRLPDGTWASVLGLTTGTTHDLEFNERTTWIDWAMSHPGRQKLSTTTASPALVVWVARTDRDADRGLHWNELCHARMEVAGRSFPAMSESRFTRWIGTPTYKHSRISLPPGGIAHPAATHPGASEIFAFQFVLPPSGSGPITLSLLGDSPGGRGASPLPRVVLATIPLSEPAGLPSAVAIRTQPLPATATSGPWTLTLKELRYETPPAVGPTGDPVNHRFAYDVALSDASGDHPCEIVAYGPVVDAAGNSFPEGYRENAPLVFGPHRLNITTTIPESPTVMAGSSGSSPPIPMRPVVAAVRMTDRVHLAGGRVVVSLLSAGGTGQVFHEDVLKGSSVFRDWTGEVNGHSFKINRTNDIPTMLSLPHRVATSSMPGAFFIVESPGSHLFYETTGLLPDERLRVVAVRDDGGQPVPFKDVEVESIRCLVSAPPSGAKSIVIDWAVKKTATFTFTIAPPVVPITAP